MGDSALLGSVFLEAHMTPVVGVHQVGDSFSFTLSSGAHTSAQEETLRVDGSSLRRCRPLKIPFLCLVLGKVSVAVMRHCNHGNSYKTKHLTGVAYSFRGFAHYRHGGAWWHADRHAA